MNNAEHNFMLLNEICADTLKQIANRLFDIHGSSAIKIAQIQIGELKSENYPAASNAWLVLQTMIEDLANGKDVNILQMH